MNKEEGGNKATESMKKEHFSHNCRNVLCSAEGLNSTASAYF